MTARASTETLLRTTADVVEQAAAQLEELAIDIPDMQTDARAVGDIAARLSEKASRVGRLGRRKKGGAR